MSAVSDNVFKSLSTSLVEPFDVERLQPSSYDLTLDGTFLKPIPGQTIDLRTDDPKHSLEPFSFESYTMLPGDCLLGSTIEIVRCPNNLTARVDGKSSIGRLFLAIHVTAGVIDAGWEGQITLEIVNHGPWAITLWKGMPIAQLSYFELDRPCDTPYGSKNLGSHYYGQRGPTSAVGKRLVK